MRVLVIIFLLFSAINVRAQFSEEQQPQIDSLNAIINGNGSHDTTKVNSLLALAYYYLQNPDTAVLICEKAKEISEISNYVQGKGRSYGWLGYLLEQLGDIPQALEYDHKCLRINEALGNKMDVSGSYINIGLIYFHQGDIPQALDYLNKGLKISEDLGHEKGMAIVYNNIGLIHQSEGHMSLALEFYEKSLELGIAAGNEAGIAGAYNNIGMIHSDQDEIPQALEYFHKSLKIQEKLGEKLGIAIAYNNIGALEIRLSMLTEAKAHLGKGLKLSQEVSSPHWIARNADNLSTVFKRQGNYKEALNMYELHIQMKDSMKNEETQKASIRQQTKYEFEKAQLLREQKKKEAARAIQEETSRRNNLQYSLIFLGILLFFGMVLSLGFIKVSPTVAEGIIFFAFLILFEFLLVLGDPYISEFTGGQPMYNLLANSLLAGLIFPAHAFFEKFLKRRLVKTKTLES
ncbi:MAG: tetratricopeptide repeat protein [Flavobacteriales bacterium]|nr:tetratricopeptide repeat protein [Flavobacteriales bacterium]